MVIKRLSNLWRMVRANFVIAFVLLSVVFVDIFVLYLLQEKANETKRELIRANKIDELDQSSAVADRILDAIERNLPLKEIESIAEEFLSQNNMFYRMEFVPFIDPKEKIPATKPTFIHEVEGKKYRLNNYRNCVFTLDFSEYRTFRKRLGLFYVYNASPSDVAEIDLLVWNYRIYAALFLFFSFVLIYLMLSKIVLPLRRVSRSLETMSEEYIPLLDKPRAAVEIAYNSVARNARLTQLGVLLNELVSDTPKEMLKGEDPVVEAAKRIPPVLCDYMHFTRVIVFQREEKSQGLEWGFGYDVDLGEIALPTHTAEQLDLAQFVRKGSAQIIPASSLGLDLEAHMTSHNESRCALTAILHNNRPLCYCAFWPASANASETDLLGSANGVRGEVEETFLKIISRRTLLDKEKNEVSVHLSTNLGHDLTNIIATGKWDLETLKRGVDMGIVKVHGQPIQEQRFKEAVQGLVNNSRMLQEVVNIYRAFGYANRPTYERVDVNRLVEGLARLFELSTSKSVAVGLRLRSDLPPWVIEPRMIKLVLFNMLSNSIQAISKLQEQGKETSGEIVIETDLSEEKWLEIRILDAGTGFRNESGKPMTPAELRKIFRYGFTTKRDEARGGLGLSWVWTIVTEFHEGQIVPSNRSEGGAQMRVLIPNLEHKLPRKDDTALKDLPMM